MAYQYINSSYAKTREEMISTMADAIIGNYDINTSKGDMSKYLDLLLSEYVILPQHVTDDFSCHRSERSQA